MGDGRRGSRHAEVDLDHADIAGHWTALAVVRAHPCHSPPAATLAPPGWSSPRRAARGSAAGGGPRTSCGVQRGHRRAANAVRPGSSWVCELVFFFISCTCMYVYHEHV